MTLPNSVVDYLNQSAERAGARQPGSADDLFAAGILDSFGLIDFVSMLETECGIKVPDADVNPTTFSSIESIERYVESSQGK